MFWLAMAPFGLKTGASGPKSRSGQVFQKSGPDFGQIFCPLGVGGLAKPIVSAGPFRVQGVLDWIPCSFGLLGLRGGFATPPTPPLGGVKTDLKIGPQKNMASGRKMVSMWDPRGTLKTAKPSHGGHQKRGLKKDLENVSKKGPFLTLWSCQNHIMVFKNRLFPVLEKVTKKMQKASTLEAILAPKILQNPILGDLKKT